MIRHRKHGVWRPGSTIYRPVIRENKTTFKHLSTQSVKTPSHFSLFQIRTNPHCHLVTRTIAVFRNWLKRKRWAFLWGGGEPILATRPYFAFTIGFYPVLCKSPGLNCRWLRRKVTVANILSGELRTLGRLGTSSFEIAVFVSALH